MFRKSLTVGLMLCASMALAQDVVREGALGAGMVTAESGQTGRFSLTASRATRGNRTRVEGAFQFGTGNPEQHRLTTLEARVQRLGVDSNAAEFAGEAVLVIVNGRDIRRVPGRVTGRVVDNRAHGATTGDPDTLAFRFNPTRDGAPNLLFTGAVTTGDITVRSVN